MNQNESDKSKATGVPRHDDPALRKLFTPRALNDEQNTAVTVEILPPEVDARISTSK